MNFDYKSCLLDSISLLSRGISVWVS